MVKNTERIQSQPNWFLDFDMKEMLFTLLESEIDKGSFKKAARYVLRLTPLSRPQNWKNKVDAPALNIDSQ